MERVSRFTSKHKIPATLSAGSLDVGQLIAANVVQNSSLLSESVTYVSALSSCSDTMPSFPVRALPDIATVSLGEHLKLFPTTTATSARIMLASPTSPRLRSMCKECLSISKWAEYSMGWDAPGHVPWENTLEHTTRKWLPEGSLFSSESFSRALFQARNWHTGTGTGIGSSSSPPDDIRLVDLNSEMLEMMRELHSLRSYFAETLQDDPDDLDSSHRPSVPALVVSTSYMTFPLTSPESSQNVSQEFSSGIASRRGRNALPPLTIHKKDIPSPIPYPDISTNSPQSHEVPDNFDIHPAVPTDLEDSQKSALRVEEMISNLRFQCSSMLPTPPLDDTSWNSRSPMPSVPAYEAEKPDHSNAVPDHTSARPSMEPVRDKTPSSVPKPRQTSCESRLKGKLHQPKFIYKKRTSTDLSTSKPAPTRKSNKPAPSPPTRVIAQKTLRPALVKDNTRSQKPYKMVRFALPKSEVAKDFAGFAYKPSLMRQPLSTTTTHNSNDPDSKIIIRPDDMTKTVPLCPSIRTNSIPVRKDNGSVPISTGSSPLRNLKMRTRSVNIGTPFRKIVLTRESVELKAPTTELSNTTPGRRSRSLGAHSLSRIIKGPMFALKENKRATISLDSTTLEGSYTGEKRRMSTDTVQGDSKKNRMPIHIKSLLTRFK